MQRFKALLAAKTDAGQSLAWKELGDGDLMDGEVLVRVSYSTVNYKDGLAMTGKAPVVRSWPMVPGIDFAAVVASSQRRFQGRGEVILNGWGVGEAHGAARAVARVKGEWLVPLPAAFTLRGDHGDGTAGYTAMLCVQALERHGVAPGTARSSSPAPRGRGQRGDRLLASSASGCRVDRRTGEADYLKRLGAAESSTALCSPAPAGQAPRQGALGRRRRCGGQPHAGECLRHDPLWRRRHRVRAGAGHGLTASVAPFILRGVPSPASTR